VGGGVKVDDPAAAVGFTVVAICATVTAAG